MTRANSHLDRNDDVEIKLPDVVAPLTLEGTPLTAAGADFVVLPQPGHTPGSVCLLYRRRFLFAGDHLAFPRTLDHIVAPRLQCWQDWQTETESVAALAAWAETFGLGFEWRLPGYGEWQHFAGRSPQQTAADLRSAVAWMRAQPPGHMPLPRWVLFVLSRTNPVVSTVVRTLFGPRGDAAAERHARLRDLGVWGELELNVDCTPRRKYARLLDDLRCERAERQALDSNRHAACFELREIEYVVEQRQKTPSARGDATDVAASHFVGRERAVGQSTMTAQIYTGSCQCYELGPRRSNGSSASPPIRHLLDSSRLRGMLRGT